jgi:hypothetical protein
MQFSPPSYSHNSYNKIYFWNRTVHVSDRFYVHHQESSRVYTAVRIAKAAACDRDTTISFKRIPKSTLYSEIEEEATQKWQEAWESCTKAATTKQFFPNVRDRVKLNINVNSYFTAIVTGHGKTRAYLNRFKIIENATCPCNKGDQTIDPLLNQCTFLQTQRELLRKNVLKSGSRPVSKEELITKHLKSFLIFTKSIDFD